MKFENYLSDTYVLYQHRYRSRKALARLNSSQLNDIGLTKEQAQQEVKRPFWIGSSDCYKKVLLNRATAKNMFTQKRHHLIEV